jgi:hypothetical protein
LNVWGLRPELHNEKWTDVKSADKQFEICIVPVLSVDYFGVKAFTATTTRTDNVNLLSVDYFEVKAFTATTNMD